jgi:uncharacterized protein
MSRFLAWVLGVAGMVAGGALASAEPVVLPRADRHDFVSHVTGRAYRVQVAMPGQVDPAKRYPVVYVLDGNWYFLAAAENVAEAGSYLTPAIIVGVGYPTDDNETVATRRCLELTPAGRTGTFGGHPAGGGDDFLRVLTEEIQPYVSSHYPVDPRQQTLYGKSLGGLMVLRTLFRLPHAFQNYVAASPAIFWDGRMVLEDEGAFAREVRVGARQYRLLITSAGDEQYRGPDPIRRKSDADWRLVDNAAELAARLQAIGAGKLEVKYSIFADEDHVSVSLASLGRALNFALRPR